jgi:hypothetical protein
MIEKKKIAIVAKAQWWIQMFNKYPEATVLEMVKLEGLLTKPSS